MWSESEKVKGESQQIGRGTPLAFRKTRGPLAEGHVLSNLWQCVSEFESGKCRGRALHWHLSRPESVLGIIVSFDARGPTNDHVQLKTVSVLILGFYLQLVLKGELMFELGHMNPHHPEPESLKV